MVRLARPLPSSLRRVVDLDVNPRMMVVVVVVVLVDHSPNFLMAVYGQLNDSQAWSSSTSCLKKLPTPDSREAGIPG
jgi:hypothetical protein